MDPTQYQLNTPQVVCEPIECDLVLVHFESGLYYSVRGTGAEICTLLMKGMPISDVVSRLSTHYQKANDEIARDVRAFVATLVEHRLLRPGADAPADAPAASITLSSTGYQPPRFEKFDDMADQLLLDKIEEQTDDSAYVVSMPIVE